MVGMTQSKARRFLSRLTAEFGTNGMLIVQKSADGLNGGDDGYEAEGADLVPGSALRWPKCECGHSLCPDSGSGRMIPNLRDRRD